MRKIVTARVPSFVAMITVIGLGVSTAARNHLQWTACGGNGLGHLAANHVKMDYVMEHGLFSKRPNMVELIVKETI